MTVVMRWAWQCGHDVGVAVVMVSRCGCGHGRWVWLWSCRWVWLVIILGKCDCGHHKLDKFIEGGILHVLATIVVCSNDIPRAGIMDASHKDCNGYQ